MANSGKSFYLTTPIYYVNDAPHIGHAYTTVAGDVLTRWHRSRQENVWFLTGTDEHGQKVMRTAENNNTSPQEWADRLVANAWEPMLATIDAKNDDFIRTTQERHTSAVQKFMTKLHESGHVYSGKYEGYYSVRSEEFVPPNEIGDDPENPGGKISTRTGEALEWVSEQNYFFKLSAFTQALLDHYEANPDFIQPTSARNEVISFVKQGLDDVSVSRSTFSWGVNVPWDQEHVFYVWFDALLNYTTAVGLESEDAQKAANFANVWPADVHLVGKDILRFHAVYWPAMLMAAGLELPKQIFAHGWLLVGGEKMSKTKLNGISPQLIVDTFGSDAFRYYFMRAITFGQDGSFSWEDLTARYNAELANGLGNLAARITAMISKYFSGVLPAGGALSGAEETVLDVAKKAVSEAEKAIDGIKINEAINSIWTLVDATNLYLTQEEPWKVAKDPAEVDFAGEFLPDGRLATILVTGAQALAALAVLLNPVMPKSSAQLWQALGGPATVGELDAQQISGVGGLDVLPTGALITKGASLFPRIESADE